MFRKRLVLPVLGLSLLFVGLFLVTSNSAIAASNLSWGSRGTEVVQLQDTLNNRGYWCGTADGIFGANTYNALINFQKDTGLTQDGTVGSDTRQALGIAEVAPSSGSTVSRSGSTTPRGSKTLTMVATGYDSSWESNYPYYGQPSYIGLPLARGIIAVDPNVIPMGTRLYIEGYGEGIAADQGGAIKGNRVDLFFDSRQEALDWGMKTVKVTIL